MRIIGGTLKGRAIPSPPGSHTRPTTDVMKEGLFSVLVHHHEIAGSRVLDLCAGSGQLSWEALSRGAAHATLVDTSVAVCKHLRELAKLFEFDEQVTIVKADALAFVRHGQSEPFNLIVVDPPYAMRLCNQIVTALSVSALLAAGAFVVLEHGDQEAIIPPEGTHQLWHKGRGGPSIDVLRYERPLP